MEHFIRIAFWIAALAACLRGYPVEIKDWYTESVKCADSTMYSPENVQDKCFITALNCIMDELKGRAIPECDDPNERLPRLIETLNNTISTMKKKPTQTVNNSSECDCQKWLEKPFDQFAKDVKSLLQEINTKF